MTPQSHGPGNLVAPPKASLALPNERYEISLIQRDERVITTITLPHEAEEDAAMTRAREALLLHPAGTEVTVYKHTLVLHSHVDEQRNIRQGTPEAKPIT